MDKIGNQLPDQLGNTGELSDDKDTLRNRGNISNQAFILEEEEKKATAEYEAYLRELYEDGAKLEYEKKALLESIARSEQILAEQQAAESDTAAAEEADSAALEEETKEAAPASPEATDRVGKRAKKSPGFKRFIVPIAVALAATTTLGALGSAFLNRNANKKQPNPRVATESSTDSEDTRFTVADNTSEIADDASEMAADYETIAGFSTYRGQFASEDGTTYNPNKKSRVCFGEALETGLSETEMKEEFASRMAQPAQLAATYTYMLKKTTDPNFGIAEANYDNPNDLTAAIESNSELHQKVYDYILSFIGDSHLFEDTITGTVDNYYMDSKFETGNVDTSKVEIVGCTTQEDGTAVYVVEHNWVDEEGNVHTDQYTFKVPCGGQGVDLVKFTEGLSRIANPDSFEYINLDDPVIIVDRKHKKKDNDKNKKEDSNHEDKKSDDGSSEDKEDDDSGDEDKDKDEDEDKDKDKDKDEETPPVDDETPPADEETPDKKLDAKNTEAERAYAGEDVAPMTVDPNAANSEEEHEAEEVTNRESVSQQVAEDNAKAEEAARAQTTQAVAEEQARQEATQAAPAEQARQEAVATPQQTAAADTAKAANEAQEANIQQAANEAAAAKQAAVEQAQAAQNQAEAAAEATVAPEANSASDFEAAAQGL